MLEHDSRVAPVLPGAGGITFVELNGCRMLKILSSPLNSTIMFSIPGLAYLFRSTVRAIKKLVYICS